MTDVVLAVSVFMLSQRWVNLHMPRRRVTLALRGKKI